MVDASKLRARFVPYYSASVIFTIAKEDAIYYGDTIDEYGIGSPQSKNERAITGEHVQNNLSIREMLGQRGIKPEELPPSEDIKKLERRVKLQEKKLAVQAGKLPESTADGGVDDGE